MPLLFKRLFRREAAPPPHRRVYAEIVAQARREELYTALGVPDTLEGRYEMVMLHAFLLLDRLRRGGPEEAAFGQAVFDEMFLDMDHNLREIGIGDVVVGKHIRRMAELFYGHAEAYGAALAEPDATVRKERLKDVLKRNIHPDAGDAAPVEEMARYVLRQRDVLAGHPLTLVLGGRSGFAADPCEEETQP